MRWFFLAMVALSLAISDAAANEVEFISPRDGLLTTNDTLVVIGRAQRGRRLNWSVRREGATESDTVTADWGNLFEIFVLLDTCDSARFSPLGSDPAAAGDLYRRAESWIGKVEKR